MSRIILIRFSRSWESVGLGMCFDFSLNGLCLVCVFLWMYLSLSFLIKFSISVLICTSRGRV